MVGEKCQSSVVEKLFCLETDEKMGAATKRTAIFVFGRTMFALRGIIQNNVIARDFATPFQDGLPRMIGKSALWTVTIAHLNEVHMRDQHDQNLFPCITDEKKMDWWF